MLNGGVEYVDQYEYIQTMLSKFRDWSTDASELLEAGCDIFPEYLPPKADATATLCNPPNSCTDANITKHALESMMIGFIQVTIKQLADFLPDGGNLVIDVHCVVYVHSFLLYMLKADAGANNDDNCDENDNDDGGDTQGVAELSAAGIHKGPQS